MLELVRAGVAEKAGQRGAWRAAGARGGQPKQGGLPVINPVGLAGEVRRFILAYGPMGTAELMRRIGHFFTVAGRNPIDNFHTVVGKAQGIRYCRGVGFVVDDLLHLEPALRSTLRYRREDDGPPSREDAE